MRQSPLKNASVATQKCMRYVHALKKLLREKTNIERKPLKLVNTPRACSQAPFFYAFKGLFFRLLVCNRGFCRYSYYYHFWSYYCYYYHLPSLPRLRASPIFAPARPGPAMCVRGFPPGPARPGSASSRFSARPGPARPGYPAGGRAGPARPATLPVSRAIQRN